MTQKWKLVYLAERDINSCFAKNTDRRLAKLIISTISINNGKCSQFCHSSVYQFITFLAIFSV